MLTVSHLNQYYGGSHILRDVSFEVPTGQCTTLLGRNGVGKTTLLRCLMGLATQKRGVGIPQFIFEMFPVLKDMLGRRGGDLSGGQHQQLAIGRALTLRPKLLILDEPTEGIQPSIIKDIERAIRKLTSSGEMAILLVEQYYDFAKSLADHYVVMSRGEVVAQGKGADMDANNVRDLLAV